MHDAFSFMHKKQQPTFTNVILFIIQQFDGSIVIQMSYRSLKGTATKGACLILGHEKLNDNC